MPVIIQNFEATAAPAEPSPATPRTPTPPTPFDNQRALRQLLVRAARLRAH